MSAELLFPCLCLVSRLFAAGPPFIVCAGALTLTAINSMLWPDDWFGGYSYAIDAGIFSLSSVLFASVTDESDCRYLSVILWLAAIYNGVLAFGETLLTSTNELSAGVILLFNSIYNHYGQVMTALSVCIWAIGVVCGLDASMDDSESVDSNLNGDHSH